MDTLLTAVLSCNGVFKAFIQIYVEETSFFVDIHEEHQCGSWQVPAAGLTEDYVWRREGLQVHQDLSSGPGPVLSISRTSGQPLPLLGAQYPPL